MRQPERFALIDDRRAIIDRRAIADRLTALPAKQLQRSATALLQEALDALYSLKRLSQETGR